jgi:DNA polymerase (family 10)
MVNGHVALAFDELATLLELAGESPFKVRAYRAFADEVRALTEPLAAIDARGELESMPGVGKAITGKVRELLTGGTMQALERVRAEVPGTLRDLLRLPNLGPGRVRKLWQEAGVTSTADLIAACRDGRVAALAGFGSKMVARLLVDAEALQQTIGRVLLAQAHVVASWLIPQLLAGGSKRVRTAGAVRRGLEIVDELTLVVDGLSPSEIVRALAMPSDGATVVELVDGGAPDGTVIARPIGAEGPRIRIRPATAKGFVEALLRETGDDAHVAALEQAARTRGTTLQGACAAAADEDAVYASLGLPPIPPELREGGVIEPPATLLPVRGVRGIFHVHTTWSDGIASIADMARAAAEAGYEYIGISDHSRAASYANGLDEARLQQQREEIEAARRAVPNIRILHGIEVDVMEDGSLDLPDACLATLEFVVASLHAHFALGPDRQTFRMVRALSHPLVTILGHPTGRLLLGRPGYTFDLDAVARAAAASGACLEINASPQRLDLAPEMIRRAAELGARFCINPDAHEPRGFADVPLGVSQARRAALRTEQVFNTLDTQGIVEALAARRAAGMKQLGIS